MTRIHGFQPQPIKNFLEVRIAVQILDLIHSLIITLSFAEGATSITDIFLYEISEDGLDLVDTKEAFKEAGEEHPHPGEEEFSVKGKIPWENIKKWTVYKRSKKQSDQTRKDFDDGQKDKRSDPLVRSVKFRV